MLKRKRMGLAKYQIKPKLARGFNFFARVPRSLAEKQLVLKKTINLCDALNLHFVNKRTGSKQ